MTRPSQARDTLTLYDYMRTVTFKPLLRQGCRRCASYASLAPPLQLYFPCTGTAVPTLLQVHGG